MPIGTSPFRPKSRGAPSRATPSPPPVPPKPDSAPRSVIDLNSSSGSYDRVTDSKVVRRAVLCDVVVENQLGEETTNLLSQLGQPLEPSVFTQSNNSRLSSTTSQTLPTSSSAATLGSWDPSRKEEMEQRLQQLTEELMRTERSYVSRIEALQKYYASPLRFFAKQGNTVIIPKYHAKTLFGNIDAVLPAAQTFLSDLEEIWASGQASTLLGDVCLRHLKTLKTLEPYGTYIGNQDEAQKIFQDLYKSDKSFVQFVDATKQQTTGIGNIGLRELLMEPVQRIPRYTMLWQSMAKCMPPLSEQRSKLLESVDIASRIARCEADEQTVKATVMYCLQRNIDGIPASIFSNHRNFIDSIDVEDLLADGAVTNPRPAPRSLKGASSAPAEGQVGPLHCTLFLFDDQLIIAKRPSAAVSGRKMTGLDDIAKLVKSGGGIAVKEKDGMKKERLSFRGAIDILKVSGMDLGAGDFQLLFDGHASSSPLFADQSDRWIGRPQRSYTTIHPPHLAGFDPGLCKSDKRRFLNNLWAAQALCRTRPRHKIVEPVCRAIVTDDDVEVRDELMRIKAYWNLWDRQSWTTTDRKVKVAVQVTEDADVPELQFPQQGGPALIIRLEAMPGAVCRLEAVTNLGVQVFRTATSLSEVNEKIVEAINACHMLKVAVPRGGATTPSSGTALFSKRASRFGTDIARNLWGNSASSRATSSDLLGYGVHRSNNPSIKSRSLDAASKSTDMLTISSISTNPPKTPRSDRSPISPTSPTTDMEYSSTSGHLGSMGGFSLEPDSLYAKEIPSPAKSQGSPTNSRMPSPVKPQSPLSSTRSPEHRGNLALASIGVAQPVVVSRVAAMRQQIERKMNEESLETLATPGTSPAQQPSARPLHAPSDFRRSHSPIPHPEPRSRSRSPMPTVASSVFHDSGNWPLSRETSVVSRPGSPTKGEGVSRSNTMSPRGPRPRGAVPRNGYVPPLPPPTSTTTARALPVPPSGTSTIGPSSLSQSITRQSSYATTAQHSGHSGPPLSDHTSLVSNTGDSAVAVDHHTDLASNAHEIMEELESELAAYDERKPSMSKLGGSGIGLGAPPRMRGDDGTAAEKERSSSQKRTLGEDDQLEPRKRSASGSSSIMARVGSENLNTVAGSSRRVSAKPTTRRNRVGSSTLSPNRIVSTASVASSLHTLASAMEETDIVMSDHADILGASDSARQNMADARKLARRIRMDASTIRKIRAPTGPGTSGALARSPSTASLMARPNIHTMFSDQTAVISDMAKADLRDIDELARHIASAGEKLEGQCVAALADSERVRMLVRQVDESNAAYEATISTMDGQLARAKEREDLLQDQLRRRDLELEEIYNAFNAELDGMYNDMSLPQPDAAGAAMRRNLQAAKAARNVLDLENKRLKLELEEEKLKREQWSQLLTARGLLR